MYSRSNTGGGALKPKTLAGVAVLALAAALVVQGNSVPKFEFDPNWPKPLPHNWVLGAIGGNFVDAHDHIWVANRPGSLDNNDKYAALDPPQADCCVPAPSILEFDAAGNLIQGWGGPGSGPSPAYEWPDTEHGIFVDYKENIWICGNGGKDTNILK